MCLKWRKIDTFASKLQKLPSVWGSAPRPPSTVTKYLVTMSVCDTVELHQFVQHRGNQAVFVQKKTNFWFTALSKILVARLAAFTAVDKFFKRLWAANKTS